MRRSHRSPKSTPIKNAWAGHSLGSRPWAAISISRGPASAIFSRATSAAAAKAIRFDARPQKLFVRAIAESFTDGLAEGARLAILDVMGDGSIGVIVRYAVSRRAKVVGELTAASNPTTETIARFVAETKPDFIWIHVPTDAARRALGIALPGRASHLVRRDGAGWAVRNSWPYPGYDDPDALPD